MKRVIFLLVFFLFACSEKSSFINLDASIPSIVDGALMCNDANLCACIQCNPSNADNCKDGICQCGNQPACGDNQDCRFGQCITVDLTGQGCEFDDECNLGYECIEGHCTFVSCVDEVCDGIDNDCDGKIDNINNLPLSEYCFSVPVTSDHLTLPCQAGVKVCTNGVWSSCLGEIPPKSEGGFNSCNNVDDNCDGCVDSLLAGDQCVAPETGLFDVVFAIDVSGSMLPTIEKVKIAVNDFSDRYRNNSKIRFALILFPDPADKEYKVVLDFSTVNDLQTALALISIGDSSLSYEPTYDVLYDLFQNTTLVSWNQNAARIIIIFSDEEAQSYKTPVLIEQEVCDASSNGEAVFVYTNIFYRRSYDCFPVFDIKTDLDNFNVEIDTLVSDPCGE